MDRNQDIRQLIRMKRLRQYEVAQELHISEFTLSRWLHNDLASDRRQEILDAINTAATVLIDN